MDPVPLSHFDILEQIAAGGMGVVYRARDRVLEREVALKVIRPERAGDADARRRFVREARATAVLNHPGIAAIYEAGEARIEGLGDDPQLYFAEELIEGETLAARIHRGRLTVDEVTQLGIQLADALGAAHARGIVHRDIKPSNLMRTPAGALKILDFGIAKDGARFGGLPTDATATETSFQTVAGVLVGTPAYMAPEQIAGAVTPRADVYAAGCVLYELLTGQPPFSLTESPRSLAEARPDVPRELVDVIGRALAREPSERYSSGAELAVALRQLASAGTVGTASASASWARRLRAWAAVAVVTVAFVVIAWALWGRFTRPVFAFKERDFVVVADVVNETGEPVFDIALKSALETDLRQSRYVNVVDASQVQTALRFSRVPPDTRLDVDTGRNVCRRVGAQALLVPRILKAGEAYQLEVTLVEPSTGRAVDAVGVKARGREEVLLSSIDRLTSELRKRLGESMSAIADVDPPFAQYTTSSLEALHLLGLGTKARDTGDFEKARRYYQEALRQDPRFAAARGSLGLLLIQFLGQPDEGRKMLAQALEEGPQLSEREYLPLRAVNKQFVAKDLQGALDDYRFIAELYPDLMPPYNNSGQILERLNRPREAAAMYEQAIRVDPRSSVPLWNLWFLSVRGLKDPARAERTARELIGLHPDSAHAAHTLAWSLVAQRRFREAEDAMRAVLKLDPNHAYALPNLGHLLFRRGALKESVAAYRQVVKGVEEGRIKTGTHHLVLSLGLALSASGETNEARQMLVAAVNQLRSGARKAPLDPDDEGIIAGMLAAAGKRDEARALTERLGRNPSESADLDFELARTWAVLGDRARAIGYLRKAFASGYDDPYTVLIDPALALVKDDPVLDLLAPRSAGGAS